MNLYDVAVMIAAQNGTVCADDLHGYESPGHDTRVFGIVLAQLRSHGVLEPIGYKKSGRAACHARPIMIFRLKRGV